MNTKDHIQFRERSNICRNSKDQTGRTSEPVSDQNQLESAARLARSNPASMSQTDVLHLQRALGNQAVDSMLAGNPKSPFDTGYRNTAHGAGPAIQTKLTVGPANDRYEQEADEVAKNLTRQMTSPAEPKGQRQGMDEEEEIQAQRQMDEEEPLQGKFASDLAQRQEDEEELQMKPLRPKGGLQTSPSDRNAIRRQAEEEEEIMAKPKIQRIGRGGGDIDSETESAIHKASSSGQPLPGSVREPAENAFKADLSDVKVHTGAESDSINTSLQSRAFTTGSNIFFKQGEYNPGSSSGQNLIAHELTHVIQQGAGKQNTSGSQDNDKDQ